MQGKLIDKKFFTEYENANRRIGRTSPKTKENL